MGRPSLKSVKTPTIFFACIFYCFCAMVIGNGNYITVGSKAILTLTAIYYFLKKGVRKHINNTFYTWNVITYIYLFFTLAWTVSKETSISILWTFGFVVVCNISLFYLLTYNSKYSIRLLKYFIIFALLMVLRGFLTFGSIDSSERGEMAADGFNVNILGMNCAIGLLGAFYFFRQSGKNKTLYLILMIILGFIIILTGSKKALLIPLIAFVIYKICHSSRRTIVFTISGAIIIGALLWYLLMNVTFLYDNVGVRFEGLLNGLTGDGKMDASSQSRLRFIEMGYNMIQEKLTHGYGVGTFRYLNYITMGDDRYSHNNFIELTVGGGIIGLLIYYWIYAYCIYYLIKIIKKTKNELSILFLAIIIGFTAAHYGFVAYYDLTSNIILTLITFKTLEWKKVLNIQ